MEIPDSIAILQPLFSELQQTAASKLETATRHAILYAETGNNKYEYTMYLRYITEYEVYSTIASKIANAIYNINHSYVDDQPKETTDNES